MNVEKLMTSLEQFGQTLPLWTAAVALEDAAWRPASGAWSILEVVAHLADEEQFDFRPRLESTLRDARAPWPPIDPERWAVERRYNKGSLADAAARFASLRAESVSWLRGLESPDWNQTHVHPQFGPFRAGDLLSAWAAHDHLHLRQIAKRQFELVQGYGGDYSTRYAGEWRA